MTDEREKRRERLAKLDASISSRISGRDVESRIDVSKEGVRGRLLAHAKSIEKHAERFCLCDHLQMASDIFEAIEGIK